MSDVQEGSMSDRRTVLTRSEDEMEAFIEIYEQYYPLIICVIRQSYLGRTSPEELAQSIFVSLMQNKTVTRGKDRGKKRWDTFDPGDPDGARKLLFDAIDRHYGKHRKAGNRNREVPMSVLTKGEGWQFDAASDADVAAMTLTVQEIIAEIDGLPEQLKEPAISYWLRGETYEAIAERLKVSAITVKRRVERAAERLRPKFGE
jgi:RNA polymerase sigma factor (sigma-70 family)